MIKSTAQGIRFEAGAIVPAIVEEAVSECSFSFCDVTGFGRLKWMELAGASKGETIRFEGPLQLIDLKGRLRCAGGVILSDFVCTVSRHTDNGIQILGGELKQAEIQFAELTFLPLDTPLDSIAKGAVQEE